MRHKVPRLKQSFTVQGMSPMEILVALAFMYIGWKVGGLISGNPMVKIGAALGAYMFLFPRLKDLLGRYPPGWFNNYIRWLFTKDVYAPLPDESVVPLISYNVKDEAVSRGANGEKGVSGEHPEPAAAS
jgi:hypothetical protein